jgi:L-ascorbate metabolism protein UlaG (beta-lactamase superfamily)
MTGDEHAGEGDGAEVTYVGHASVVVRMDGVTLMTDPVLRNRVAHLRRTAPPVGPLPPLDAILVSHQHGDHLDPRSLVRLGRELRVIAPPGAAAYLRRRGFRDVVEVRPGDDVAVGTLTVRATQADHAGARTWGQSGLAVGFLIEGTRRIYFAGDTDLFPEMSDLAPVDAALLPIWGWGPTLGPGHLDPAGAAQAAALLRARVVVPIHWGTYAPIHVLMRSRPAFLDDPPIRFREELAVAAPDAELRVLAAGETTRF